MSFKYTISNLVLFLIKKMNTPGNGPGSSPSGYQELRNFFKEKNKQSEFSLLFNNFCQTAPFWQSLELKQMNFIRFLDEIRNRAGHNFQAAVKLVGRQASAKEISSFLSTYLAYRKAQKLQKQTTQSQLIGNLNTKTDNQPEYIRLLKIGKAVLDLTADEQKLFEKICKKHKGKKIVIDYFYQCYLEYKDAQEPESSDIEDLYRPRLSAHEEVINSHLWEFRSRDYSLKHGIKSLFYHIEEIFRKHIN